MSSAIPLHSESTIRLLDLARELRDVTDDREDLRRQIAAYLNSPFSAPRLAAIGRALTIDPGDFRQLLRNAEPLLALAWGDAAEMHGLAIPIQLALSSELSDSVEMEAIIDATLEGNARGSLHDGSIRFDAKERAALVVRLRGGLELAAKGGEERGMLSHAGSVGPAVSVEIENVLLVPRMESALAAARYAIDGFVDPRDIPSLFRAADGESPLAGRIVRIGGTRAISLAGRFRWAGAFIAPGEDDEPLRFRLGTSVAARFDATMEGDFQIVIEPREARRVAVSVSRRRTAQHRFRAAATAGIGLGATEGLARLAVAHLSSDVAEILLSIERNPERWTDLHALFEAAAEERVDALLAGSPIVPQIEAWLRSVAIDVDLRRRVRRLAAELLGEAAARAIDGIEAEMGPALDAAARLIVPLHRALARLHRALDAAARARLEIELAAIRKRAGVTEVAFTFDVDPVAAEAVFHAMLRGDFHGAFELAESGDPAVRLEDGGFGISGTLEIASSLTIGVLGTEFGTSTLLTQEWDAEVGVTGDVLLGVRTALTTERRRWRRARAARVLLETALLAELENERLIRPDGDDFMTIETEIELEPSEEELREFERRMIDLGALAGATSMHGDLLIEKKRVSRRPFGALEAVASLRLTWENLHAIASADLERARATFANLLFRWAPPPAIPGRLSHDGIPLFAWPSVLQWAEEAWPDSTQALRFHDAGALVHADVPPGHATRALYLYARTVLFFERALLQLRAMATRSTDAVDLHRMARALRREHRALLRELGLVVGFVDSAIGEVLFSTMLALLPPDQDAETFVVVRREDGKRFVYS